MRIIFMGSPKEVISPLEALINLTNGSDHELVAVVSQPAKSAGRRKRLIDPPVAEYAKEKKLHLLQPASAKVPEFLDALRALRPDIIVTAAYGQILSDEFLRIPTRATINLHPSCIPSFRGATPVPSALLEGCERTGITILFTVKKLDAGPIISMKTVDIEPNETCGILTNRLFKIGGELLPEAIEKLMDPNFTGEQQNDELATHCTKIKKEQGLINWSDDAEVILKKFRAFHPWPGSFTFLDNKRITIENMRVDPDQNDMIKPGQFYYDKPKKAIIVSCKKGTNLAITELKPEGRNATSALSFINGLKGAREGFFHEQ
jgi:methionyl-tRNA formyltransferase